ncbi:MAG TPA: NnrS family protein [Bryobacteraceae bacterium]|nr:NnrS family protein [Bryobacteraceae bacterium]
MPAPSVKQSPPFPSLRDQSVERERQLQRALIAYIVTGLFFMLLPGTFLGVWNLISISSRHALESLSPAWLQAHGHAQIFGWIGTFILGIGFYSLSKMGKLPPFAVWRAWLALALWAAGTALRWIAGVSGWQWRVLLPVSTLLELSAFLVFFRTVSGHRAAAGSSRKPETWMLMVIASTLGFLASLVLNAVEAFRVSWQGSGPALPHVFDQTLVALETWCFLVVAIWGFNARWLPVFLGLREPDGKLLLAALGLVWAAVLAGFAGASMLSALLLPVAAVTALFAVRVWHKPVRAAKTAGVHSCFPWFIRIAYAWLLVAAALWVAAAWADHGGGIWGAARHALTVGFISTMVFSIGQRILPAFGGARVLYSPRLMLASLAALTLGCTLRVSAEIPAYEWNSQIAWHVLPCSAIVELLAVTLFAVNLLVTLARPPAHLQGHDSYQARV